MQGGGLIHTVFMGVDNYYPGDALRGLQLDGEYVSWSTFRQFINDEILMLDYQQDIIPFLIVCFLYQGSSTGMTIWNQYTYCTPKISTSEMMMAIPLSISGTEYITSIYFDINHSVPDYFYIRSYNIRYGTESEISITVNV